MRYQHNYNATINIVNGKVLQKEYSEMLKYNHDHNFLYHHQFSKNATLFFRAFLACA